MRKIIIIILIVIAIPIYTYNMYILLKGALSGGSNKGDAVAANDTTFNVRSLIASVAAVHFEKKGRSPFLPYPVSDKPRQEDVSKVKKVSISKEPVKAPLVTVNGIMWNPQNPVAMLGMPDGTSAVAKVGQVIAGITIKKIEKTFVVLVFEKREFRIER